MKHLFGIAYGFIMLWSILGLAVILIVGGMYFKIDHADVLFGIVLAFCILAIALVILFGYVLR